MSDMVNSRKLTDLHPYLMNLCKQHIANCAKRGVYIIVTDVMRSDSFQAYLYEQGRSREGNIVTWTKTTYAHGMYDYKGEYKSMAYDVAPLTDDKKDTDYGNRDKWKVIIEEGKKLGLEHGTEVFGKSDDPHWQLVQGITKSQLKNGKRPLYWNKETDKLTKPLQSPLQVLKSKCIISDIDYWDKSLKTQKYVQSQNVKALITNFYRYLSGTDDFIEAINYLNSKKVITNKNYWLDICARNQDVDSEYVKLIVERMVNLIK